MADGVENFAWEAALGHFIGCCSASAAAAAAAGQADECSADDDEEDREAGLSPAGANSFFPPGITEADLLRDGSHGFR